jgi:pyruvate dehydrogenase E2 component (dihydrolipoamide acetyltransferase)
MATAIPMPALSPTMKEGKITKWLKKEGEKVSSGDAIAEVETDKSNLEVEAYDDGFLISILVPEGSSVPVGSPIGYVGAQGEKAPAASAAAPAPAPPPKAAAPAAKPAPTPAAKPAPAAPAQRPAAQVVPFRREAEAAPAPAPAPASSQVSGERVRVSPLAKKMAREQGLDLAALAGSGPSGRIIKRDIEAAISQGGAARQLQPAPSTFAPSQPFERREPDSIALTSMRKVITQRMGEVKPGVPHFYLSIEVEMDAALKIREEAKSLESKVSVNDIIVKAAAIALRRFPKINVQYAGDRILQLHNADVGIAVAIEDGLITPVIRDADQKGLSTISAESRDLAERARKRGLKPAEYTGGSITVSNLGMFGIDSFIAVINPPQASILAVGAVTQKPVVRDGQVVVRSIMSATLSGDHRAIDGALGAQYLKELKALLEHPMRLLF